MLTSSIAPLDAEGLNAVAHEALSPFLVSINRRNSVFYHIINDITPAHQTMYNRPANRMPVCIALEVKTAGAEGLRECRKLMTMAKAGKYKGYLLEGMACPGG